ncbi:MAG: DnaJ domain-containing protein, partial [Acidimicrobiia bacterium]
MAPQREWFEKDYYAVLGLRAEASDKEVARAYRKLAKQHHPDANPDDRKAEERFKEISGAYEVLGDAAKRKEYDEVRKMARSGMGAPGGFGFGAPGAQRPGSFRFEHIDDVGDLGGVFGGLFGRRGRADPAASRRGGDLEAELHLSFGDAVSGATTAVRLTSEVTCSTCAGSGAAPGSTPVVCSQCQGSGNLAVEQGPFSFSRLCPRCGGAGRVVENPCPSCAGRGMEVRPREVKVRIPAGVADGQRIRIKG